MDPSLSENFLDSENSDDLSPILKTIRKHESNLKNNFRFPSEVNKLTMKKFLKFIDDPAKEIRILKPQIIEEESMSNISVQGSNNEEEEELSLTTFKSFEDRRASTIPKFRRNSLKESKDQKNARMYKDFLRWKVFGEIFEYNGKISLFEADKSENWLAFRIDSANMIKVINIPEHKEYSYQGSSSCPIEFLKFIENGEKIIMGNRVVIYIWEIRSHKRTFLNLLKHYRPCSDLTPEVILSKISKFSLINLDGKNYCLYIAISKFIFLFNFSISNDRKCTMTTHVARDSILYFFTVGKKELIFAISKASNGFAIETLNSRTLSLKRIFVIAQEISYFSPPIFEMNLTKLIVKFIVLIGHGLQYFEYSPIEENYELSDSSRVLHGEEAIKLQPVSPSFYFRRNITKVWSITDQIAILNYTCKDEFHSRVKGCVHSADLTQDLRPFEDKKYLEFIVSSPIVIAYTEDSIEVFTHKGQKFECDIKCADIESINIASNFMLINCKNATKCLKIQIDKKGTRSVKTVLVQDDYNRLDNLDKDLRNSLLEVFCYGKDSKNLEHYLSNNKDFGEEVQLPAFEATFTNKKSTECTKILLDYYIGLKDNQEKIEPHIKEIEANLHLIITSNCSNLVSFLDSLILTKKQIGSANPNKAPMLVYYEDSNLDPSSLFFEDNTLETIEFDIKSTVIHLPDINGSAESLELASKLIEAEIALFSSQFIRYYILKKWIDIWPVIFAQTLLMWMNCSMITLAIAKTSTEFPFFYCLFGINVFFTLSEIIQLWSLGPEKYIGIKNIQYIGNTAFIVALCFIYFKEFFLIGIYALAQLASSDFSSKGKRIVIGIRFFPYFVYFISICITDNLNYAFLAIVSYEFVLALLAAWYGSEGRFLSLHVKITVQLLLLGYGLDNLILVILYSMIFAAARINDVLNFKRYGLTLTNYLIIFGEVAAIILLYSGYFMQSKDFIKMMLCVSIPFQIIIGRDALAKTKIDHTIFRTIAFAYSFYMLIAFYHTKHELFLTFFFFFALFELVYLKNFELKLFKDDLFKLIYNWNTIDILRAVITYIWLYQTYTRPSGPPIEITWIFASLNIIRGLTGFRAFDSTRFFVRLILNCAVNVSAFVFVFIYITLAFGLINLTVGGTGSNLFESLWIIPYDMVFGNLDHPEEINLGYITFIIASLLLAILMRSLLVSILGDTYAKFRIKSIELDYQEMMQAIYESEVLLFWRKWKMSRKYFAICDLPVPKEDELVSYKIDKLRKELGEFEEKVEKSRTELKNKMNRKFSKIEKQLQIITNILVNK